MSFKYGASITQRCNLIYKNEKTASLESVGRPRKEFAKLNGLAPHFVIRHNKEENGGGTAKLWKCALNTARMRGMQFCGDNILPAGALCLSVRIGSFPCRTDGKQNLSK